MDGDRERAIGEILLARGAVTERHVDDALNEQSVRPGERLGDILVGMGACPRRAVLEALAHQVGVPYVDLDARLADPTVLDLVPRELRERHLVHPMFLVEGRLTLAMVEPTNVFAIEEVGQAAGAEVLPVLASAEAIRAIAKGGRDDGEAAFGIADIVTVSEGGDARAGAADDGLTAIQEVAHLPPVIRLVNYVIYRAIKEKASDIHIEPYERMVRVRYRVDGVLYDALHPPQALLEAMASRLKIMAALDIGERRLPQDGRIKVLYDGRRIDLRVSFMPTTFGEKVVMRILDRTASILPLDAIGFDPATCETFRKLVRRPHGIILVTGPTGSGKTTTLYSALSEINEPDVNISTVEDPIEYNLDLINQVQTNVKIGLKFATVLRTLLRQDPDVIMVGEVRDRETADIAIQAALTGHLVLSTLHTNDAPGAVTRLLNMGVEAFLVSSSLTAVLAQRLVRKVCAHCSRARAPSATEAAVFAGEGLTAAAVHEGKGCVDCRDTGYRGRLGIYELLVPDEEMRELVTRGATSGDLRRHALERLRMRTLRRDALEKALHGTTTVDEALRITVESSG
jgi:type IV pilus assembly protein PilB